MAHGDSERTLIGENETEAHHIRLTLWMVFDRVESQCQYPCLVVSKTVQKPSDDYFATLPELLQSRPSVSQTPYFLFVSLALDVLASSS